METGSQFDNTVGKSLERARKINIIIGGTMTEQESHYMIRDLTRSDAIDLLPRDLPDSVTSVTPTWPRLAQRLEKGRNALAKRRVYLLRIFNDYQVQVSIIYETGEAPCTAHNA